MQALKLILISSLSSILWSAAAYALDAEREPNMEVAELPSLSDLQGLLGRPATSSEFLAFRDKFALKLYSRKEITTVVSEGLVCNVNIQTTYGGPGFVLHLPSNKVIEERTGAVIRFQEAAVSYVGLIYGHCDEQERFGTWKGEWPRIGFPPDPEALLRDHVEADYDNEEISFRWRKVQTHRRVVYFGGPTPENVSFPFGYIYNHNRLCIVMLLKQRAAKVIEPGPLQPSNRAGR
jgi:hypothetical protein